MDDRIIEVCLHALARVAMQNGGSIRFSSDEFRHRDFNLFVDHEPNTGDLVIRAEENRKGLVLTKDPLAGVLKP